MGINMILEILRSDGSIVINKKLAKKIGLHETILYAELVSKYLYFEKNKKLKDDWFYNTLEDLEESTTLTRFQQDKAIKNLINIGLIEKKTKGIPATRYFRITDKIMEVLLEASEIQFVRNSQTRLQETYKLDCKKLANKNVRNQQEIILSNNTNNNTNTTTTTESKILTESEVISTNQSMETKKAEPIPKEVIDRIESVVGGKIEPETFKGIIKYSNISVEDINKYLDNWHLFVYKTKDNPMGFFISCLIKKTPIPSKKEGHYSNNEPPQKGNFEQRKYDDEYFDSLYDN